MPDFNGTTTTAAVKPYFVPNQQSSDAYASRLDKFKK